MVKQFDTPISTSDLSLDRVLAARLPVALIFLPKQPARNLEAKLNDLARQHAGSLLIAKIEAETNPVSARTYKVGSLPALVGVRDQQVVTQASAISEGELVAHIAYLLGQGPKPTPAPSTQTASAQSTLPPRSGKPISGKPIAVSEATFQQEVMQSPIPVLVDFWAPWCGPCRMVEPIVERLAAEMAGTLRVAKVNVDENQPLSIRYGVQGIPTMIVVKNGQIVERWSGAVGEAALRQRVSPWVRG